VNLSKKSKKKKKEKEEVPSMEGKERGAKENY